MSSNRIKVTDKRRFAADGTLRDDFPVEETPRPAASDPASTARPEPSEAPPPPRHDAGVPGRLPTPEFLDLVRLLAEPAAVYLGDVAIPDGGPTENLEMARMHIDFLDVLQSKTSGNLSVEESTVLEDVLYRLRMRYVEKSG